MRQLAHKFGLLMMLAAAFTVAGHIYQHCFANPESNLNDCRVCQSIMGTSVHAAQPAEIELVFLRDAVLPAAPEYYFSPAASDQSRAPPRDFFS